MNHLVQGIERFIREEEGVTMVEYGLIAALISVVCILFLTRVGTDLNLVYKAICNALNGAVTGGTGC